MPRLIVVLEPREPHEIQNLLNAVQSKQDLPEGVQEVTGGAWLVDFPKCALFLSKLLVTAHERHYTCRVFEIANPSEWEFVQEKREKYSPS